MTYEVTMLDESAPVVISSLVFNRQDAQSADLPERRPADPRLATVLPRPVLNLRAAELAGQLGESHLLSPGTPVAIKPPPA